MATYSNNASYAASQGPNFMWNEEVTYSGSAWTYTPIKYWPNETDDDKQSAENPNSYVDRLSFFAYAPYVSAGSGSTGITALTANNATTDPKVTYTTGVTLGEEDLVWGVANPTANVTWNTVSTTIPSITVGMGMPYKDLIKPSTSQTIKFYFRHALAALNLKVQGVFDEVTLGSTPKTIADGTYITIESINVTATVPTSGVLNLNNTTASTPLWDSNTTKASKTFTVDGDHGLISNLKYNSAATNGNIAKGVGRDASTGSAITTAQDVIAQASSKPQYFMFVPPASSDDDIAFTVKIKYHVWTYDTALDGDFSKVENEITKTVTINDIAGGNIYTIKILLGMTSVKLEGEVDVWGGGGEISADLPKNN